jgi:hypothetical protein
VSPRGGSATRRSASRGADATLDRPTRAISTVHCLTGCAIGEILGLVIASQLGSMDAGITDALFWGSLALALGVAGVVAFPVNR